MKKIHKLFNVLLSCILIASLLFAGCGSPDQSGAEAGSSDGAESAGSETGGILVYARASDATNLDSHYQTDIPSSQFVNGKIVEGLLTFDKDLNIQPVLAESYKQIDDVTWEFKLRQGVKFHDGSGFNADAVKINLDRILNPDNQCPSRAEFSIIKEVKAVDEYTVQIILNQPSAPFEFLLAGYKACMLSPEAIAAAGKEASKIPVGTGPFVYEEWLPGQEFRMTANPDYWGKKPAIGGITFKIIPEDATRLAMLETGEADICEPLAVSNMERVQANSSLTLVRAPAASLEYVGFNVSKAPFDNQLVREAVSHAIDRQAIINGIYLNTGKLGTSTMSSGVFGFNPNLVQREYDPEKAKELLAQAGLSKGLKTKIIVRNKKEHISMAEAIQSQLKDINIDVEIVTLELGAYNEACQKGDTEMYITQSVDTTGDADYNQFRKYHSSSKGAAGNHNFYGQPDTDALIEQARVESDRAKRQQLYYELQEIEMERALIVPIREAESVFATRKNIKGFTISPTYNSIFTNVVKE